MLVYTYIIIYYCEYELDSSIRRIGSIQLKAKIICNQNEAIFVLNKGE